MGGAAHRRPGSRNPLSALYRTADGRYLSFVMLQAARYWAEVCHHVGRPDLADDPRFADAETIDAHAEEAAGLLREAIAAEPLSYWVPRLATLTGPWAPVQDTLQVGDDPQVAGNGYIATVRGRRRLGVPAGHQPGAVRRAAARAAPGARSSPSTPSRSSPTSASTGTRSWR